MKWGSAFRQEAVDELQEIFDYYEDKKVGLGDEFLDSVDDSIELVCSNPFLFMERLKGIRAKRLSRFPYTIYYAIELGRIKVLSVIHNSRNRDWIEPRLL